MSLALAEISREAMELPIHERLVLANQLLASADALHGENDEVTAAWEAEIKDRIRAIDEGRVVGVSFDEVMRAAELQLQRNEG